MEKLFSVDFQLHFHEGALRCCSLGGTSEELAPVPLKMALLLLRGPKVAWLLTQIGSITVNFIQHGRFRLKSPRLALNEGTSKLSIMNSLLLQYLSDDIVYIALLAQL